MTTGSNGWAPGEVWDSLSRADVQKLIRMTADVYDVSPRAAAFMLAERWEERAWAARRSGLSSWRMWDRIGLMAWEEANRKTGT